MGEDLDVEVAEGAGDGFQLTVAAGGVPGGFETTGGGYAEQAGEGSAGDAMGGFGVRDEDGFLGGGGKGLEPRFAGDAGGGGYGAVGESGVGLPNGGGEEMEEKLAVFDFSLAAGEEVAEHLKVVERIYKGGLISYILCRIFRLRCCRVMGLVLMWWLRV